MNLESFQDKARVIVYQYVLDNLDTQDGKHKTFGMDEVYVISFDRLLGNWKAKLATTLPEDRYYELTYDADERRTCLEVFVKFDTRHVDDWDLANGDINPEKLWRED